MIIQYSIVTWNLAILRGEEKYFFMYSSFSPKRPCVMQGRVGEAMN